MSNIVTNVGNSTTYEPAATMAARLQAADAANLRPARDRGGNAVEAGSRVRVTESWETWNEGDDTAGELLTIDRSDPRLTFYVKTDNGQFRWVHNVVPAETPAAEEEGELALLRRGLTVAEERRRAAEERLREFKNQVREVAIRVAEEQGWCDGGLNDVLDELGLDPKVPPRQRIEVTITATVYATPKSEHDPDPGFVKQSIDNVEISMDGDWDDVEVADYDVTVTDIEPDED